jgi:lipoyl(octanoyl) transferase
MIVEDLGTLAYRDAWAHQEIVHAQVVEGAPERLLLVEHPPVITLGRRPGVNQNLVASEEALRRLGVELVQSDRGGDITFHGPGQLVAYPIIRMLDHHLSVGGYVRRLEETVIAMLREIGIAAQKDPDAIGIWAPLPALSSEQGGSAEETPSPALPRNTGGGGEEGVILAKICAVGVRIRRGVTMHGAALNVTTDLNYFNLIVPCGLAGRPVTSIQQSLGKGSPTMAQVKARLAAQFESHFS